MPVPVKVGDEIPVFWDTRDGRPPGRHRARVLAVLPYRGTLDCIICIARVACPAVARGWVEMSIDNLMG